jgi:PAS domain S-box-containing protein
VREVSAKAVTSVLEVLEGAGISVDALLGSIDFPIEDLRGKGARVSWDDYITFVEAIDEQCSDILSLEEIGARLLDVPSFQFLQLAAKAVISPKQLYMIANSFVAPAMFSNITVTTEWVQSSGRLVVTGEIAPGYRESEALHRLCHGNVVALPKLIDLPASAIDEQMITGRRGRLVLIPPISHTVGAKIRRGLRAAFSLGDAMRALMRQQSELEGSLSALRSSRHELRQLIERFPEGVLIHRGGVVVWMNAAMLETIGYGNVAEVVGRRVTDLLSIDDRQMLASSLDTPAQKLTDERLEYRVLRPDGTVRLVEAGSIQHVEFEGVMSRLVVLRDVTEHHRLHDRLATAERMALLGRLAAGVAHEINNPLAYVHTSIEVASRELAGLADHQRTARLEEALVRAREGTERVRGIVRDMKLFTRVEGETTESVDLAAVLDSTLALSANVIGPRARVIRRYGVAPRAHGTRGRLGQLFLNLLLNAVDSIPEGNPEQHEIRVTIGTDGSSRALVEIADTGGGIAPAHQPHVFDPFFTTKAFGGGTGLGLPICHGIVTQFGGELSFESTLGKGTTFRVVLPASTVEPIQDPVPARDRGRGRVLIIDDEPELLRSLDALIGDEHDVVTASSGRAALELLHADRGFDVILTDLMMADVTGMELFEKVRSDYPGLEQQFVFMTGGAFTRGGNTLLSTVPNRCLAKPFDADELLRTVGELVEKMRPELKTRPQKISLSYT